MPKHICDIAHQAIAWISKHPSNVAPYVSSLNHRHIEIQIASSVNDWQLSKNESSPCAFLINLQDSENIKQDIYTLQSSSPSPIIGIAAHDAADQKESFILAGGDACLTSPFGEHELYTLLKHHAIRPTHSSNDKTQIEEVSQMALLAMENSSDLGGVISFIKKAMVSKDYSDLAESIFKAIELDCDTCLVEMKGHQNNQYFSASKVQGEFAQSPIDKDMQQYLLGQKQSGRIVTHDNIIQINQSNLVILLDGIPYQDSNKIARFSDNLVILSDIANRITESLATEKNLQIAEKDRQSFLNTLSHELRTPLNSILGFSKALTTKKTDKALGDSGFEALTRIIESTEQVNAIISTLIEISGHKDPHQNNYDQKIEVDKMLVRLQHEFKQKALEKGLTFNMHCPNGLHLFNNASKLYNVLTRLVDNAVKFTESGHVSIDVTTDSDNTNNQQIIFKVSDTGIGIAEENHQRIFNEIGQLNTEHDRSYYGIGIGLYYAQLVTQQINGQLTIKSAVGEGSEFSLSLPITLANKPQIHSQHDNPLF